MVILASWTWAPHSESRFSSNYGLGATSQAMRGSASLALQKSTFPISNPIFGQDVNLSSEVLFHLDQIFIGFCLFCLNLCVWVHSHTCVWGHFSVRYLHWFHSIFSYRVSPWTLSSLILVTLANRFALSSSCLSFPYWDYRWLPTTAHFTWVLDIKLLSFCSLGIWPFTEPSSQTSSLL